MISDPHVLRDYSLIADGERGALVGPEGAIAWMCFPQWHSGSVFSTLAGNPGEYTIQPSGRFVWGGYYEERSLIWRSRWITSDAVVESREALVFPSSTKRAVLLRQIIGREGESPVRVVLQPCPDYGRDESLKWQWRDGAWQGETGGLYFRWHGVQDAKADGNKIEANLVIKSGECVDLVLEMSTEKFGELPNKDSLWRSTESAWRAEVPQWNDVVAQPDVTRSYALLRGLTTSKGSMVAAATACLPERARAGRSYDYRYAWIRDQAISGRALARAGHLPLLGPYARFVIERVLSDGPKLSPAYTVDGEPVPPEHDLNWPGYPGGGSTIGNHAGEQFQLDAFGEVLGFFAEADRYDELDADGWRAVDVLVDAIAERHNETDNGIWETESRHWTQSKLMCAAGLRAIAGRRPGGNHEAQWLGLADSLVAEAGKDCVHPSGRWQRAVDDSRVDASLLLPGMRGAIPLDDPRHLATIAAVEKDLCIDGYVYRFKPDGRRLGEAEGAFLLCGFWLALAKQQQGDTVAAARLLERNRAAVGPPGILSEEFDVGERQLRGNLPQGFVHATLLETAFAQSESIK